MLSDLLGKRVLIVEDDYLQASEIAVALELEGSDVIGPFPDLAGGLDALDNADIDAAILDVHLGCEKVFHLADRLWRSNIPFIIVTGYNADEIPDRFDNIRCFLKPADVAEVAAALATTLAEYSSSD